RIWPAAASFSAPLTRRSGSTGCRNSGWGALFEHDLFRPGFARRSAKPNDGQCQGLRAGGKPVPTPHQVRGRLFRDHAPMAALSALLRRDMRLAVRVGGGALMGVLFFLIVVAMVPFALGPDLALLARTGPAIMWLAALLASLLALDRLFAADPEDGSLDLILMGRAPLELAVATKALAHWLTTGLPLVIAAPLLGLFLNLAPAAIGAVALTLLVGTPALTCIGLIGAALAVALRRGG